MDTQQYRDECSRQLFRLKLPAYIEPLQKLFNHYQGLDDYLELERVPEVELARILQLQQSLNYIKLTHILKEIFIAGVRVCSNEFHHAWNPYECTFREFLDKHRYVRVWDEDSPSHLPDTLLVTYCD